ncbi:MAG TPA: hypothetical protein VI942_11865 [Thermoanaerobaculia bacterium]|nr:hypothetical protein [Thermoanaerobaculia bacterium]
MSDRTRIRAGFAVALSVALVALVVATFRDYGLGWDEPEHDRQGLEIRAYYQDWLRTGERPEWQGHRNTSKYGGLFEAAVLLAKEVSPLPWYDTRHLVNALAGLLAIGGAAALAGHLGGAGAACWAIALLALTPRFYGDLFHNSKDIPFAAAYVWSLALLARAMPDLPRLRPARALRLGAVVGAAMAIRIGGLILLGYLALLIAIAATAELARERAASRSWWRSTAVPALRTFALVAIPAWLLPLPFWPWAQEAPLARPIEALLLFGRMSSAPVTLFAGGRYKTGELPASYLAHYLAITLPEIVLLLLLAGAVLTVARFARSGGAPGGEHGRTPALAFVAFAALYPLAHIATTRAPVFDGMRHVLFVVPPLVALAGCVAARLAESLRSAPAAVRAAAATALAAYLVVHVETMVRLHPYQSIYFNRLVGGLAGAAGRYDTDYWALSYRELVRGMVARGGKGKPRRPFRVWACEPDQVAKAYLPPGYALESRPLRARFKLATTRIGCSTRRNHDPIARVERFGVTLALAFDLSQAKAERLLGRGARRPVPRPTPPRRR